jgi:hypothetical protein
MPGKRLVQFDKVPHTPEIQGRIGQQLKAQYDDAEPFSRNFWNNLRNWNF